jgi:hypothetical protein
VSEHLALLVERGRAGRGLLVGEEVVLRKWRNENFGVTHWDESSEKWVGIRTMWFVE